MSNPSVNKRQKEKNRQDKARQKELKRQQRRSDKEMRGPTVEGEDPDLVGIIPGPQPPLEE